MAPLTSTHPTGGEWSEGHTHHALETVAYCKRKGQGREEGGGRREGALVKRGKVGVGGGGRGGKVRVRREGESEEGRWE